MSYSGSDTARIAAEYDRRARELPADFYSWRNPANLMMHQDTAAGCIGMLDRASLFPLRGRRIADIGCGDGTWLLEFMQWGADPAALSGIDLNPARLASARVRCERTRSNRPSVRSRDRRASPTVGSPNLRTERFTGSQDGIDEIASHYSH